MSYLVSFSPSRLYRAIPSGSPQPRRSSSILATKLIMKINPGSTWMASDVGRGCTSRRKRLNTPRSRELWQETSSESLPLLIVNYFKEKADYETHRHGWKSFDNVRGLYIETNGWTRREAENTDKEQVVNLYRYWLRSIQPIVKPMNGQENTWMASNDNSCLYCFIKCH